MYTIVETDAFVAQAAEIWTTPERMDFFAHIAKNPLEGDVIPNGGGLRKVRWQCAGRGKRGGVRVIYFGLLDSGLIVMVALYAKSEKKNVSPKELKQLRGKAP